MGKNVKQVYDNNPSTSLNNDDLLYIGKSPYAPTDDSGIKHVDYLAQIVDESKLIVGPALSTDNSFPLFDGTTGKLIKNQTSLTVGSNTLNGNYSSGYNFQGGSFQFGAAGVVADVNLSNSQINWSVVGNNVQGKYKNSGGTVFSFTLPSTGSSTYVKISSQTVAGPQSFVDFIDLSSAYSKYVVEITNMTIGNAHKILGLQVSTNNGSTFLSSATDYSYSTSVVNIADGVTATTFSGAGAAFIAIGTDLNTSGEGNSFTVNITSALTSSYATKVTSDGYQLYATTSEGRVVAGGRRNASETNNAIRFLLDSGQITGGTFTLYGIAA